MIAKRTIDSPPDQSLLTAIGITKSYGPQIGCFDISLKLRPGEVLGIVGESGSGKSTLLACLSGRKQPDAGSIVYDMSDQGPVDILSLSESDRRRLMRTEWGIVHQNPRDGLRIDVSAGGNIGERRMAVGVRHYGRLRSEAQEWLRKVEIDLSRTDDKPRTFSGGEGAIEASHKLLASRRRGDAAVPEIDVVQIAEQMRLAVDRVMTEGMLYDLTLAALAIKQAQGDLTEAIFLVRAARATLERFGTSEPIDTRKMTVRRRISTTHKDIPGGQILGPTYDYTHRLIDTDPLSTHNTAPVPDEATIPPESADALALDLTSVLESDLLETEICAIDIELGEQSRVGLQHESNARSEQLQGLANGDEGFLLGLAYSSMLGYGNTHALLGEIRFGDITVEINIPELGITVGVGEIDLTECQTLHPFNGALDRQPKFTRGYGLAFGQSERKAISMAVVDRALRAKELGEEPKYPIQDRSFVLGHADNVNASGFVQVLKLPHYVHFQGHLQLMEKFRQEFDDRMKVTMGSAHQ